MHYKDKLFNVQMDINFICFFANILLLETGGCHDWI